MRLRDSESSSRVHLRCLAERDPALLDEFREALKEAGCLIVGSAADMLNKTPCTQHETEIDLVNIFPCTLGLTMGGEYREICARAVEMGFELCPAEVGPALRLSYKDQPEDEWLRVASEAIITSDGGRAIFIVGCGSDGLWLEGDDEGHPDTFWHDGYRFVFKHPSGKARREYSCATCRQQ